jgi:hypothetical protein
MKHIIVVNGQGGVGKDTFCLYAMRYMAKEYKFRSSNISTVDEVKGYGKLLGWDGVKDEKGRKFLSDLKALSTIYNGPLRYVSNHLDKCGADVVFVHIREPEEISKFVNLYPSAITIIIKKGDMASYGNKSDDNVNNYPYNYCIDNNGSKDDLKKTAIEFVNHLMR